MRLLWDHNDENESESPNFKMPMKTLINTSIQCTSTYLYLTGKRLFLIGLMTTPHEEQGIKEFHDNEFLTRKKDKENKELASIKKRNL